MTKRLSPATVFARSTGSAIWRGPKQDEALARLTDRTNLKLLIGPASSGKSKILQLFGAEATDRTVLACHGPQETAIGVLSSLLISSEVEICTMAENEQRTLLASLIKQLSISGKRVAICVDDVGGFSDEAWTEITRLTHLTCASGPLVDLVVTGRKQEASRPSLNRFLRRSNTSQVEAIHFLAPPDSRDLESYIAWRLKRFEIPIKFNPDACAVIARKSAGRFGLVNLICQVALWDRNLAQPCEIDADDIRAAVAKLAALKTSHSYRRNPLRTEPDPRPAISKDSIRLTVYLNNRRIRQMPLKDAVIFGRGENCDVHLHSRSISRHHAMFTVDPDGTYFVSDLGSTNGVLVNGKFIKRTSITDGDIIDLCEFRIRVELVNSVPMPEQDAEAPDHVEELDTATLPVLNLSGARVHSG